MALPNTSVEHGSAFEAIQNIDLIETITTNVEGSFLEEAVLRNRGQLSETIEYKERTAPFTTEGPEIVAEKAEIPLVNSEIGKSHFSKAYPFAAGVEFSWQELRDGDANTVSYKVRDLQNAFVEQSAKTVANELSTKAGITVAASADWTNPDANPLTDILSAKRQIASAGSTTDRTQKFGFTPNVIVASTAAIEAAQINPQVLQLFTGILADQNPLYTGDTMKSLVGLRVLTSAYLADDEIYVLDNSNAGFYGDVEGLWVSGLYQPNGESGRGGTNRTFRIDMTRERHIVVDNPQAVAKITGIF